MNILRVLITAAGLVLAWQAVVSLSGVPNYILPGPFGVAAAGLAHVDLIFRQAWRAGLHSHISNRGSCSR